jgi:predicted esterase
MKAQQYARYLLLARVLLVAGALVVACIAFAAESPTTSANGVHKDVVFTDYSPLAASAELARRVLSPLRALHLSLQAARSGTPIRAQSIDLAGERFAFYVPPQAPPHGYALLVFVPPWDEAGVPREWLTVLDRHDMICVSAANSDNSADLLKRREPLALLAAANIMRRYPIDPERIYITGFSGGSRVAERLALGYPDVFRGALLNASSDPLGDGQIPLPPADLLQRFQERTRIVFVTGARDKINMSKDIATRRSLQQWCVFDFDTQVMQWRSHEMPDRFEFSRALDALVKQPHPDSDKLSACRARIETELAAQLGEVDALFASGKAEQARRLLVDIDARYGGLAAPRSIELAGR